MKKTFIWSGIGGILVLLMGVGFYKENSLSKMPYKTSESPIALKVEMQSSSIEAPLVKAIDIRSSEQTAPWDKFSPLTEAEKEDFELVTIQIQKFNTWGKIEESSVQEFRNILFRMGDRAVAETARDLANLSKNDIKDKADAEAAIKKVDELAYFAKSKLPIAHDSIRELALRPVKWDEKGNLLEALEANITFEVFDLLAQHHPEEAIAHIRTIEKRGRPGYFAHYAYGRKLSGKNNEQIDQELRSAFGSPELALK